MLQLMEKSRFWYFPKKLYNIDPFRILSLGESQETLWPLQRCQHEGRLLRADQDDAGARDGWEAEPAQVQRHQGGQEDPGLPGPDEQALPEDDQATCQQLRCTQGENGQVNMLDLKYLLYISESWYTEYYAVRILKLFQEFQLVDQWSML